MRARFANPHAALRKTIYLGGPKAKLRYFWRFSTGGDTDGSGNARKI
jgi:hypothetical protein